MKMADLGEVSLHYQLDGPRSGPVLVLANALGTDLRLWDGLRAHLPPSLRVLRYDFRGHGLSSCPRGPYSMGALVRDAERLLDHLQIRDCVFVGLSIGGMVAQGLAVKRLNLVRGLVLSNTAAKIGLPAMWEARIADARAGGIEALADATMERWFSRAFRDTPKCGLWRNMLTRQPLEGYLGCMAAISGTDLYTPTSGLRLPTLGIAGSEDGATPPDLVRETVDLIPGSTFHLIRQAGHLPCVENPRAYTKALNTFLTSIGHV